MESALKWVLEKIFSMKCWIITNSAYQGKEITNYFFSFVLRARSW